MAEDLLGIGKATEALSKELASLIGPLLRPGAEVAGQMITDQMNYWRLIRAVSVAKKAKKLLDDNNIEPRAVPDKIMVPILNNCSLEEDDDLASKWAGLLASAAAGNAIHPSYPRILAELTPTDAQMLEAIYQHFVEKGSDHEQALFTAKELNEKFSVPPEEFTIALLNLRRLELCDVPAEGNTGDNIFYINFSEVPGNIRIRLTPLGKGFMIACHGPQPLP